MRKSSFNSKLNRQVQPASLEPLTTSVRVRKIRFHDEIANKNIIPPSFGKGFVSNRPMPRDAVQRLRNFEEFQRVYKERITRQSTQSLPVQQSKSGSILKFSRLNQNPKHVDVVNISMPPKFGSGSAIISVPNNDSTTNTKNTVKMVSQSILTENIPKKVEHFSVEVKLDDVSKRKATPKQAVNTVKYELPDRQDISKAEELFTSLKQEATEIQNLVKQREKISKNLPKLSTRKRQTCSPRRKDKIWSALTNINEKLQKMQQKYFQTPKVKYKSMHDISTQRSNVEVLFENKDVLRDESKHKTFEYPKVKDTLTEIEAHLDRIANMNIDSVQSFRRKSSVTQTFDGRFEGGLPNYLAVKPSYSPKFKSVFNQECEDAAEKIVNSVKDLKTRKMKAVRQDIASVEDLLDKISHITDSDAKFSIDSLNCPREDVKMYNFNNLKNVENFINNSKVPSEYRNASTHSTHQKETAVRDYAAKLKQPDNSKTQQVSESLSEDEEIPTCIKKSFYLSKEFHTNSNIKVFKDDNQTFVRDRPKCVAKIAKTNYGSEESLSKLIDSLKASMGNTLYTPVSRSKN